MEAVNVTIALRLNRRLVSSSQIPFRMMTLPALGKDPCVRTGAHIGGSAQSIATRLHKRLANCV